MDRQRLSRAGVALAAAAGICTSAVAPATAATDKAASISGFAFAPNPVAAAVGRGVAWTNADFSSHTVTEQAGIVGFDTGTITRGATKVVNAGVAGRFTFICTFHAFMTADLIVKPNVKGAPTVGTVAKIVVRTAPLKAGRSMEVELRAGTGRWTPATVGADGTVTFTPTVAGAWSVRARVVTATSSSGWARTSFTVS